MLSLDMAASRGFRRHQPFGVALRLEPTTPFVPATLDDPDGVVTSSCLLVAYSSFPRLASPCGGKMDSAGVFETMNVTRSFAVAATFAAVAVDVPAPASAAPVMSGHYIKTVYPAGGGQTVTEDWFFTPCGDGCADMWSPAAGGGARAMLVNGRWTIDAISDVVCKGGTTEGNAANAHYAWDPNTLAGTVQVIQNQAVCDHAPQSYTVSVQLKKAP